MAKKIPPNEFEKLKTEWYKKLSQEGFHDIEQDEIDTPHLDYLLPMQIKAQEEYYAMLSHAVLNSNTKYKNIADKLIMLRHAEGMQIKKIVEELARLKMPKERKTVRIIIRRYLMAWGIRSFTRAQLNLKEKE